MDDKRRRDKERSEEARTSRERERERKAGNEKNISPRKNTLGTRGD